MSDSNGLASGNNMEEAILHGLLEIIERDQVFISEYNRLPFKRIIPESVPGACKPTIDRLTDKGFRFLFYLELRIYLYHLWLFSFSIKKILQTVLSHMVVIPILLLQLNVR